ncbi:MAG: beta-ketoacyl-[acyl-carrier-protein] synthase family protein [Sedimentisphaerales bacterium]|nr:beta-ketoacyl-[acyl-carrier-protein] synthase family protein [Sedimentisphaerales bacterium]
MKERVVITGMGIVCPIGHDVQTMWDNLLAGRSGAATTTIFDAGTFPTTFGAEVKNYDLSGFVKNSTLHEHGNRGSKFVLGATVQACRQAGIDVETDPPSDGIDRERMGIYLGAGEGSVDNDVFFEAIVKGWKAQSNEMDWAKWTEVAHAGMTPYRELEQEPNLPAGHIALLTGARGETRSCLTACAASTQAVGEAVMMIRHGRADIMIAGGAHSMIHPLGVTGFNRLTALSTRNDSPQTASRPFSATRDGFVLGEGAAIVILESLDSARRRGAAILAEITGFGSSNDAFRVTDMHEEARGAVQAMQAALKDAGVTPEQIDYISSHGTSTTENDSIETLAIKKVFLEHAAKTPISSPKSVFGHLIGATGCAELITCVLAIRDQILPPTMNLHDPDPALDLDYVPNKPRKASVECVMKESFGFGGQNNVLILKRFEP